MQAADVELNLHPIEIVREEGGTAYFAALACNRWNCGLDKPDFQEWNKKKLFIVGLSESDKRVKNARQLKFLRQAKTCTTAYCIKAGADKVTG